jgi:hypothetical protein
MKVKALPIRGDVTPDLSTLSRLGFYRVKLEQDAIRAEADRHTGVKGGLAWINKT